MESVAKQPIHFWLLYKIERAQYLSELLEAGELIFALKFTIGHAELAQAWEEGWRRVGEGTKVPNLIESEYYQRVLDDLKAEEEEAKLHAAVRMEAFRNSVEGLRKAAHREH